MRPVVHPLLDFIRQPGAIYTWSHPFSIKVTHDDNKFVLSDPDQLPDLFLEQDLVNVPNWLDSPDDHARLSGLGPLPQCHRRSVSYDLGTCWPTSSEDWSGSLLISPEGTLLCLPNTLQGDRTYCFGLLPGLRWLWFLTCGLHLLMQVHQNI